MTEEQALAKITELEAENGTLKGDLSKANSEARDRRLDNRDLTDEITKLKSSGDSHSEVLSEIASMLAVENDGDLIESIKNVVANPAGGDTEKQLMEMRREAGRNNSVLRKKDKEIEELTKSASELDGLRANMRNMSVNRAIGVVASEANIPVDKHADVALLVRSRMGKVEQIEDELFVKDGEGTVPIEDAVQEIIKTKSFEVYKSKSAPGLGATQGKTGSHDSELNQLRSRGDFAGAAKLRAKGVLN